MKQPIVILFLAAALSGCISKYALMENTAARQRAFCSVDGYVGLFGYPFAASNFNDCVARMEKAGYRVIGDRPPPDQ